MKKISFQTPAQITLPQQTFNPTNQPTPQKHYLTSLQPEQLQTQIHSIATQLLDWKSEINTEFDKSNLQLILDILSVDFPEILQYQLSSYQVSGQDVKSLQFQRENKQAAKKSQEQLETVVQHLKSEINVKTTEIDKFRLIYEKLIQFTAVNNDSWEANSVMCLLTKKATPLGISRGFKYLADKCGLFSYVVQSKIKAFSHYFNVIYCQKQYANVDCFIPMQSIENGISYAFFAFSDMYLGEIVPVYEKLECSTDSLNLIQQSFSIPNSAVEIGKIIAKYGDNEYLDLILNIDSEKLEEYLLQALWCSKRFSQNNIDILNLKFDELNMKNVYRVHLKKEQQCQYFEFEVKAYDQAAQDQFQKALQNMFLNKKKAIYVIIDFYSDFEIIKTQILGSISNILTKLDSQDIGSSFSYSGNSGAHVLLLKFD